jgi:thiosulfate dehydrogenase [quinone] large subunit
MAIGWHFLREGFVKLSQTHWSAIGYLSNSWGPFSPYFKQMAENPDLVRMADIMVPWALTLAGIGLIFGIFTRLSSLVAIGLLIMFYLSTPPWGEPTIPNPFVENSEFTWAYYNSMMSNATWAGNQMIGAEGNYQIVNKNLIEMLALIALLTTNTGKFIGFDGLIGYYIFGTGKSKASSTKNNTAPELQPVSE